MPNPKKKETINSTGPVKKYSKRDFIKLGGVAAAGAVAAVTIPKKAFGDIKKITKRRLAMVLDLRKCTGCHSCSVACKAEFDVPLGVWRANLREKEKGKYPKAKRLFLPTLCNQCDDPPCIKVCPVDATYKRNDGIVTIEEEKCIGCKRCIPACPYKARFMDERNKKAEKCSFCQHLIDEGVVPSCVNTCPGNARIIGDLNDPKSLVSKLIARNKKIVKVLKPKSGTKPQVFYISPEKLNIFKI